MDEDQVVHDSRGNVFADMGMPDAEERLARAERARAIRKAIEERGARGASETEDADEELPIAVAARVLGVSDTHMARLIEVDRLATRTVDGQRRVRMADVVALKREMDRRRALLDELTALSQELGLYDSLPDE